MSTFKKYMSIIQEVKYGEIPEGGGVVKDRQVIEITPKNIKLPTEDEISGLANGDWIDVKEGEKTVFVIGKNMSYYVLSPDRTLITGHNEWKAKKLLEKINNEILTKNKIYFYFPGVVLGGQLRKNLVMVGDLGTGELAKELEKNKRKKSK